MINPGKTKPIPVRASGTLLSAFRPVTYPTVLTEGNQNISSRLQISVMPTIATLSHAECVTKVVIQNHSPQKKYIRKGSTVATGDVNFEFMEFVPRYDDRVTVLHNNECISPVNPIDTMSKHFKHLAI